MSNKNNKKSRGIEGAFFNCMGEMGFDNFGCLNSSFSLFYFDLVANLRKKIYGVRTLRAEIPHPLIRVNTLLAGPTLPPSSVCTLWMTPIGFTND